MDPAEIEKAMDKYARLLWHVARGVLRGKASDADADECVADVFIHCWEHPVDFDGTRGSLKNYLCLLAKSKAIDRLRRVQVRVADELREDIAQPGGDMDEALIRRDDVEALLRAIEDLPPSDREIFKRRYLHNEKPAEISDALGLPVRKVVNSLYRNKQRIQKLMAGGNM